MKMKKELEIGRVALFKHCDMGRIKARIDTKVELKRTFYRCTLIDVLGKDVRVPQSAFQAKVLLNQGHEVSVSVQPHELIVYTKE